MPAGQSIGGGAIAPQRLRFNDRVHKSGARRRAAALEEVGVGRAQRRTGGRDAGERKGRRGARLSAKVGDWPSGR